MSAVDQLRALMSEHKLSRADVAGIAGVSAKTVESWLAGDGAAYRRNMPERHLRLIRASLPAFLAARRRALKKKG